ncbi:dihydrofolate reductase family protein [Phycicoccus flavus]|uniref:Bacterial bifunctional deaminase-reductase C-terminal domain-containing protein n=1 Tax=Phycicoccus flavus TaxID=2502783 RepID=A0A8T6R907_9MICO|nr:hypothetical protein [Phycicoccus flavus]
MEKYVVSATLTAPDCDVTTVLDGDWPTAVRELVAADGGDIVCTGSVRLTHALFELGLVDEVRLFQYPVVQGEGRHLFPDGLSLKGARLLEAAAWPSGEAAAWPSGIGFQRWSLRG